MVMKRTVCGLAMILGTAMLPAWAQDPNAGDSPDHGVARLSLVQGNVSIRHGDMGELAPAAVNAPLVTTDRVVTGDGGRAEVQFDFTNMIRLGPSSEVRLSQLEFKRYQVQIAVGTVEFRVLRDSDAQVEISTPTVSVRPTQTGAYRITVRPDGITEITPRSGQAEIFGPRGSETLAAGQTMQARGTADDPEFQIVAGIAPDDFDRWNADRDRLMQQQQANAYRPGNVPPDVTGGETLDPYGQWQADPNYGQVWVPSEPAGWAPYQAGRWVYLDYYGWTWVSADPWGWAPYHYGSWYQSAWGWAWWPGAFGPHYYWRPALVGFFGWGPGLGVGFGFGFGNVGWVALGPHEVFHPWYGAGAVAAGRVGVGANLGVANTFRNARVSGAISSMNAANFGHGAVSANGMVRPTGADLARASAFHGALPVSATSASRRMSDAAVNSRGMPQTSANTRFASHATANASRGGAGGAAPAWRSLNGYNAPGGTARGGAPGAASGANPQSNYRNNNGSPQGGNAGSANRAPAQQQPLRMNPSIVQQRGNSPTPAPSSSGRSAPAQAAPAQRSAPAPAPSRSGGGSAPSRGGGGGGGHGGGHR